MQNIQNFVLYHLFRIIIYLELIYYMHLKKKEHKKSEV